ncbi:MAG: FHA domain-containing protein [Clostridiales bacterium]|jgi:hypothetical protein|nr:FHA domain-containing protein [Clostridiales bacterium]MDR2713736.1 FHA domain-containing protein [Clostridiales bacterium]
MIEIHSKSDFLNGAILIARIPEEEVDKKALQTILTDPPDFTLPFRHRVINGEIEFTYQIGNRSKLTYLSGNRSPAEYAGLWSAVLQPLLDCEDWFMNPYSFVLKPEYLYCDKNGKLVSFVYIPSVRACSDHDALKNMVTEIAKLNHVQDISLENKVVWAIQDFKAAEFLEMVNPYKAHNLQATMLENTVNSEAKSATIEQKQPVPMPIEEKKPCLFDPPVTQPKKWDDISISFPSKDKEAKEEKPKGRVFTSKKEKKVKSDKKVKPEKKSKNKVDFWGRNPSGELEIIQGAAAEAKQAQSIPRQSPVPINSPPTDTDNMDITCLDIPESSIAKFRYAGSGEHPGVIEVGISEGEVFTIGRFDISLGTKQSSFEFDKKTKAVSRRHAVVERNGDGYSIVDLASAAGTYMNGQKLPPNAPFKLDCGNRISFGNLGADYIWET